MKCVAIYILLIFSILQPWSECSGQSYADSSRASAIPADESLLETYVKGYYSQVFGVNMAGIFNTRLYSSIENWLGTPYRYAGKTLEGIDCSSFVNKIYESVYGYLLNGNSADMAKKVTQLPKEQLKEGDLVFFRINRRTISHVGLYLGDDKFAHASRSKGVIISDLNHPYYRKYFVKGGRVNFPSN